ncbi:HAD-IIB family hydrolase [Microlunatus lacustris]
MTYRIIAFDLDDTLAVTKSPISPSMAELLADLVHRYEVCIISGGQLGQFTRQVVDRLPDRVDLGRLHLMPTCGSRYLRHTSTTGWVDVYFDRLSPAERDEAVAVLTEAVEVLGLTPAQTWGPQVEDRGGQVTLSVLGQAAPAEHKYAWDPTGERKEQLRAHAAARLPGLEVRSGGSTSVDVTRHGIDKAYGIRRLLEATGADRSEVLFVGDRLDVGGNDRPVLEMGIDCRAVEGPAETEAVIVELLSTGHPVRAETESQQPDQAPGAATGA